VCFPSGVLDKGKRRERDLRDDFGELGAYCFETGITRWH
jgi:hypothetical protein